ncbi:UNVERIFIED_CONTAM: hypothetical protein GTU68_028614, partial [Idotea baltica]|nr:hypothetical protein [Idotea baltica]
NFEEIGLIPALERVLKERGFTEPSAIQSGSIPVLLEKDTDFIGLAQTGTGKTAAFGLPLLQKIDISKRVTQGIILCPTRELAIQTFKELNTFGKYLKGINMENVYGGTPVHAQAKRIQKNAPHIIVGTPGRVIDLLKRKSIVLEDIKFFILDEADEMLNMGFEQEIKKILEFASDDANTWLFSATMPKSIRAARGLDIKNLTHVIHYALPDTFEYYTHRSGRTGRAGEDGTSIAFIGKAEVGKVRRMEKALKISIDEYKVDLKPPTPEEKVEKWYGDNGDNKIAVNPQIYEVLAEKLDEWTKEELIALISNTQLGPTKQELRYKELDQRRREGRSDDRDRGGRGRDRDRGGRGRDRDRGRGRERDRDRGGRGDSRPDRDRKGRKDDYKSSGKKEKRKVKEVKKDRKSHPDFTDIFINIGYSDGFGDVALEDFISKNTGISKAKIGSFEVNKRYSLFGLDKGVAKQVDALFKDVDLKGRRIVAKVDKDG